MMRRSKLFQIWGPVAGLCLLMTFFASCGSNDRYVGVYQAEAEGSSKQGAVILELRANGDGLWRVSSDEAKGTFVEVPFTWYIKRGDLRVNTKAGGVIVGKIDNGTIRITLPGSKTLTFRKTR